MRDGFQSIVMDLLGDMPKVDVNNGLVKTKRISEEPLDVDRIFVEVAVLCAYLEA